MPLIFVSKSGRLSNEHLWPANRLRDEFGRHSVMLDDDFRYYQDPFAVHEGWKQQFTYTRDCNAMVVLMDSQGSSEGQDVESEDARGRAVPVAYCRLEPFEDAKHHDIFSRFIRHGFAQNRWRISGYFDLSLPEEFPRLAAWLKRVMLVPPPKIESKFRSNVASSFALRIRRPGPDIWEYMDWSAVSTLPNLVFNYGERLVRDERKVRSQWEWPEKHQVVVPLTATDVPGELAGSITLPYRGFGHALLTFGAPSHIWQAQSEDLILWWDFFVDVD
jgi:hypothetical protein